MHEDDIYKTVFWTHCGLYGWVVLPFGLSNVRATFQNLMNDIFKQHLSHFISVLFFFMIYWFILKTWEEHIRCLHITLTILKHNSLFLNKNKCRFGKTQANYLDHLISAQGVLLDPKIVVGVNNGQGQPI